MTKMFTATLMIAAIVTLGAAQRANDPAREQKLPQAIDLLESKGDLAKAMPIFEDVARSSDRALAARGLLYLAQAQERQGAGRARATYERIIRDFSNQTETVAEARKRLDALGGATRNAPTTLARRRLWSGPNTFFGPPSPDGRFLTYAFNGDLGVRDVVTGISRQITNNRKGDPVQNPAYPVDSKVSHDGKRIAAAWNTSQMGGEYQLRVINTDGSNEETIYRNAEIEWIGPVDWALDGRQVLAKVRTRNSTGQIAWISVADKTARVLKTLPWASLGRIALSPDGRYIAYDARAGEYKNNRSKSACTLNARKCLNNQAVWPVIFDITGPICARALNTKIPLTLGPRGHHDWPVMSNNRTIFVLASDGSQEVALTAGPAEEVFGWMPDGKALLFATNRRGSRELWAVRVLDGKPAGSPNLIQPEISGTSESLGITKNGSLFYWQVGVVGVANVASVDWNTGAVSAIKNVSEGVIPDIGANWSPDGRRLAFIAHRGSDLTKRFIAVRSIDTGETQDIVPGEDLVILTAGGWSPDGNSFLVVGDHPKDDNGAYAVDVKTGNVRPLVGVPGPQVQWMPNGKSFMYFLVDAPTGIRRSHVDSWLDSGFAPDCLQ